MNIVLGIFISIGIIICCVSILFLRSKCKRTNIGLYSQTENQYLEVIDETMPTCLSKITLDYFKDEPKDCKFVKMFPIIGSLVAIFIIDGNNLYSLEDNAKIIRKYDVHTESLIDSWIFDDKRNLDDLYLYGMTITNNNLIIINYLTYYIFIYTKNGDFIKQFRFRFTPTQQFMTNNQEFMEIALPMTIRNKLLLREGVTQHEIYGKHAFYSITTNNEFLYISMYDYLIRINIETELLESKNIGQIRDIIIFNNDLLIVTKMGIIIGDNSWELYDQLTQKLIFSMKLAVRNEQFIIRTDNEYTVYNELVEELSKFNDNNRYHIGNFYIVDNKIYELELDNKNEINKISISELVF